MDSSDFPYKNSTPEVGAANRPQFEVATYVEQTAALLGLSLPQALRTGVVANFEHLVTIAQPVIDFPLPETIESAATFEP